MTFSVSALTSPRSLAKQRRCSQRRPLHERHEKHGVVRPAHAGVDRVFYYANDFVVAERSGAA